MAVPPPCYRSNSTTTITHKVVLYALFGSPKAKYIVLLKAKYIVLLKRRAHRES